jgi:signal transduction histidine kinase
LKAELVADLQTLSATVAMLLRLARLSSGAVETSEIDLVAIARCVAAEYVPGALKSEIEIEFSGPAQAVKAQGSEEAIRIALSNILQNAIRYSRRGQRVVVEVCAPPTVRIIDHGPGIATEDKGAVFRPFVRRGDDSDGTGLGLAIVAQVMALHRGVVAIEDTPKGGTTVVLKFAQPTAPTASSRQPTPSGQRSPGSTLPEPGGGAARSALRTEF